MIAASLLLAVALVLLPAASDDLSSSGVRNGLIAFESIRGNGAQIFTLDKQSQLRQRTMTSEFHRNAPTWSPDGKTLAAWRPGRARRGGPTILSSPVRDPSWGPGGERLAGIGCSTDTDPLSCGLAIVDLASGKRSVIFIAQGEESGSLHAVDPSWSPSGRRIAFVRYYNLDEGQPSTRTINIIDVSTQAIQSFSGASPTWSPDSKRLAFARYESDWSAGNESGWSIYSIRADGTGRRLLARNAMQPAWSPDGKQIAFVRIVERTRRGTNSEIFVMNADGTGQQRLTHTPWRDVRPDWQPR